jgi:AcrR family transcriptional regulator
VDEHEIDGQLISEVFAAPATAEVVTEAGYAAASSKAIIERAGVSSKTFYALFGDEESAFLAAFTLLDGVVVGYARNPPDIEDPAAGHRALEHQRALNVPSEDVMLPFVGGIEELVLAHILERR